MDLNASAANGNCDGVCAGVCVRVTFFRISFSFAILVRQLHSAQHPKEVVGIERHEFNECRSRLYSRRVHELEWPAYQSTVLRMSF